MKSSESARFTRAVRTELLNLARRYGDEELEAICEGARDRESLLKELYGRPEWRDLRSIVASYRDTLEDEQIVDLLRDLGPGQPLFQQIFAEGNEPT